MLNRSLRLAYGLAVAVTVFLTFFTLQAYSEFAVQGPVSQLRVGSLGATASSAEVYDAMTTFAQERDCTVARVSFDLTDPSVRHLHVLGDRQSEPGSRWVAHGYADFSRGVTTRVHPGSELGTASPVGSFVLTCGLDAATTLASTLQEQGVSVTAGSYPTLREWHRYLGGTPLPASYAIAVVATSLLAGCGALLGSRAYAVQRLQGAPFTRILRRDLVPLARRLVVHLVVAAAVCTVVLGVYNRFAQWTTFLGLALSVLVVLLAVTVLSHAVCAAATLRIPLAAAVKGESVGGWVVPAAFTVRFVAAAVLVASIFSAVNAGQLIVAQQAARDAWQSAGGAVYLGLGGGDRARAEEYTQALGGLVAAAEDEGEAVVAFSQPVAAFGAVTVVAEEQPVLVVNRTYLREQGVVGADGERLVPDDGTCLELHLPASLGPAQQADVAAAVDEWADFFGARCPVERGVGLPGGTVLFDYGNAADPGASPLVEDPVLLVVDHRSGTISADAYDAYASTGGVVFLDPAYALEKASEAGVRDYVLSTTQVAQAAADEYQDLVRVLRLGLTNIAACAGVVLLTGAVVASAWTRRNAQAIFARYISGRSFWSRFRTTLVVEILSAVALVVYVAWNPPRTPPTVGAFVPGSEPPLLGGWEPVAVAAVCLVSAAFLVGALAVAQRRLLRTRSSDS
ncbi:hypothetical protein ACFVTZ_09200 [Cellulosimicrobium cellulans]|uniref:hypothetical protein n=1 Tax=Cellulosimicrobium cellulans TaxID=1710 RepID=UPI0036E159B8